MDDLISLLKLFSPDVISLLAVDPGFDPLYPATHQGQTHSLGAWWEMSDIESGIREYFVSAGTSPLATDIASYVSVGLNYSVTITDFKRPLVEGETYYINVLAVNFAHMQTYASSDGITVLTEAPDISNVTVGVLDAVLWEGINASLWTTLKQSTFGLTIGGELDSFTNIIGKLILSGKRD